MHHDRFGRGEAEVTKVQTVMYSVLTHRRKESIRLSLTLNAQDHHDVGVNDGVFDPAFKPDALLNQARELRWHQRAGTSNAYRGAELRQKINIRPRDSRVKYVPNDRHSQPANAPFVFPNCERIE